MPIHTSTIKPTSTLVTLTKIEQQIKQQMHNTYKTTIYQQLLSVVNNFFLLLHAS
eukprot:m.280430 g.280430  ORF g.280430 m.280430 type:complete len:55 (-) comp148278_c0_seq1:50-214(-)